jgi:hypothetical protein
MWEWVTINNINVGVKLEPFITKQGLLVGSCDDFNKPTGFMKGD